MYTLFCSALIKTPLTQLAMLLLFKDLYQVQMRLNSSKLHHYHHLTTFLIPNCSYLLRKLLFRSGTLLTQA